MHTTQPTREDVEKVLIKSPISAPAIRFREALKTVENELISFSLFFLVFNVYYNGFYNSYTQGYLITRRRVVVCLYDSSPKTPHANDGREKAFLFRIITCFNIKIHSIIILWCISPALSRRGRPAFSTFLEKKLAQKSKAEYMCCR